MKPAGRASPPPPPPPPSRLFPASISLPVPPPNPILTLATGMTVIPSCSTDSPNTDRTDATTPRRSAAFDVARSAWTVSSVLCERLVNVHLLGPVVSWFHGRRLRPP